MSQAPTAAASGTVVYRRPRAFVGARGPDAAAYLNKMLSNEIEAMPLGTSLEALLLTPKARVIAMLVVHRRESEDFLLITDPGLDEVVTAALMRTRFAAKVELAPERHPSFVQLGSAPAESADAIVVVNDEFGPGHEIVGRWPAPEQIELSENDAESRRIEAGMPRFGLEIDDRVLPAEAGLIERTVNFEKGCYPGQEPIARLHYRGHTNRGLRVLRLEGTHVPSFDAEVTLDEKVVGRVTSAVARADDVIALAYVRNEVASEATIEVDGAPASMIDRARP